MNHFHQTAPCLLRVVSRFAERLFRPSVLELTAARLPSGADVLRFDHPLLRRIVERDDARGLAAAK